MLRNISHWTLIIVGYLMMSGYNACDPIIKNNGFDLWCGENLCDWDTETGEIARVATWHGNDDGVSLVGANTAISQLSDIRTGDVTCMRFDMVAKIDETAVVTLELDFFDDGIVDWERKIPTSDWAPINYLITMPAEYEGVRFRLKKLGSGRAVVAQLQADKAEKCVEPPLVLPPKPLGARCSATTECASETCVELQVCGGCIGDNDCDAGESCGLETPTGQNFLHPYRACGPAGRHALGEQCISNSECASGICGSRGMCAGCETNSDCTDGESCTYQMNPALVGGSPWLPPRQCAPQQGQRAAGEACLVDSDCANVSCAGSGILGVCTIDGRTCVNDEDCPEYTECAAVGTLAGQCQ